MTTAVFWVLGCCLLPGAPPERSRPAEAVDTLVVCAPGLRPALQPWLDYRAGQGHQLAVLTDVESPAEIRTVVRRVARQGRLQHLVLVGDVQLDPARRPFHLPTYLAAAKINPKWGSEPELATDCWFGDLDDDAVPDLAVGRLPADSPADLTTMIHKIRRYEQSAPEGGWRRRINLVAGVGGFGFLADSVLETATRSFIQSGIPAGYQTSMTYASWRSPYCPDPRAFREQVIARLNEGCLCWVYLGHGQREGLDWVRVPLGVAPILTVDDVPRLECSAGPPVAIFLSCYGAAFDGAADCLAERMVTRSEGPVAAIGGSRVTMPYGMAVLSQALMRQMFDERPPTLGQMLLAAKREAAQGPADGVTRPWLDALARALGPNGDDLDGERREHVLMFHLLGDPLLRIAHPQSVDLAVPSSARPGELVTVSGRCPVGAACTVELACRRGQLTFRPEPRREFDPTHEGMQALTEVYLHANDDRYVSREVTVSNGRFKTELQVPVHAKGPCTVRVFAEGSQSFALGAGTLYVSQVESPPADVAAVDDGTVEDGTVEEDAVEEDAVEARVRGGCGASP